MLPPIDKIFLDERAPGHLVQPCSGMTAVVIPLVALPEGLTVTHADLLFRLSPGYPDVAPDMWWFSPAIQRIDGRMIPATEVTEVYLDRQWQRWSRHLQPGQWRSGIDSLESFFALVKTELAAAARKLAA